VITKSKFYLIPKLHFDLGKRPVNAFHLFGTLGFIFGATLGVLISKSLDLDPLAILLMTSVGAVTFFLLAITTKIVTGEEMIVYYHHEIAILIFCSITLRLFHYPVLPYLDITLLGIGTFLAFGRIGCFSVGCCHGRPHRHGVRYGQDHVNAGFTWYYKDVPLFPVQLVESVYVFLIVIIGVILLFNHVQPGTVLIVYTVIYGSTRYVLEFFRGDPERPYWHGLSEAQWTTLILIASSLALSFAGYLPLYNWHWMIFSLLVIVSVYMILIQNRHNDYRLLKPRHVREIATALQHPSSMGNTQIHFKNFFVRIYKTQEGLSISSGTGQLESNLIKHYTLSGSQKLKLDISVIHKIATIIGRIEKHKNGFQLAEPQNGIYQIVFNESNMQTMQLKPESRASDEIMVK
jgi:prolipoprotein diacylglyceryltransferase